MNKIDFLTQEQERSMIDFREKYRRIGTSCEQMDNATVGRIIKGFYNRIGKPEPAIFYCQSPWQVNVEINIIRGLVGGQANLLANLWANLGDNLQANLLANLRDNLWANLGANLWANLRDNLGDRKRLTDLWKWVTRLHDERGWSFRKMAEHTTRGKGSHGYWQSIYQRDHMAKRPRIRPCEYDWHDLRLIDKVSGSYADTDGALLNALLRFDAAHAELSAASVAMVGLAKKLSGK